MTLDLLKRKYEAEMSIYSNPGVYKRYSFLMELLNNHEKVREFMLQEGYSKTELTRTRSDFTRHTTRSKA